MGIKTYKPTSAGRRHGTVLDFSELSGDATGPEKRLRYRIKRTGGRNNHGRITARHRGGGHRRLYREIDFRRDKDGIPARVKSVEYDPNRSANIALLVYADGEKRYILAPVGMQAGQTVLSGKGADPNPGTSMLLSDIPVGLMIHNVELSPGKGGQICRSAGSYAQLTNREGNYAILPRPDALAGALARVVADVMR